jgi:hypothetical protein
MATLVQIKRSTANNSPASLTEGELAYSYASNTLFIGLASNSAINIGGQLYTTLLDNATAANSASTFVRRYANGSSQFQQLDILVGPTSNSHVATKQYVDAAVTGNVTLASLNDVNIGSEFSDQNNKILIGNTAGYYVGTLVTGNVSLTNTGIFTIGTSQVTNAMLEGSISNDKLSQNQITVTAGAGITGGGTVSLGNTITLDVRTGDGMSNTADHINVDSTVVRTDRSQTLNGASYTFSNTVSFNSGINVTGNIILNGNTTYINVATLNISDPLIYLASNNSISDTVDIGFMGAKNTNSFYSHTGLIRSASQNAWYLFDGLVDEGSVNNIVDIANTFPALLRANIEARSLVVTGPSSAANINTTLIVAGNTTISSNLVVSGNATVTDLVVTGGDIISTATANIANVTTTTLNFGGDATTIRIGAAGANTTVRSNLTVTELSSANSFISTRTATVPPNTANTNGERIRLYDFNQTGRPNYAIGVESGHIWTGIDSSANTEGFKWYGNTSPAMRLSGNGVLEVANTISTLKIFATELALTTPLPVGSGGTGRSTFTANGVFFANTTTSLSFATGTDGQVLQISEAGAPTFAMLDGGSF